MNNMDKVYKEVLNEETKQLLKWGEQNHPCLDQTLLNREGSCSKERMCQQYEIPSEYRAKYVTDRRATDGDLTYADIALEEFCEVVSEFDSEKRREELVQLAAVCISWIKKIDRDLEE